MAWWFKPLDIAGPYAINLASERVQNICAWIIMQFVGKPRKYFGDQTTWIHDWIDEDDTAQSDEITGNYGTFVLQYEGFSTNSDRQRTDVEVECSERIKSNDWTYAEAGRR